MTKRTIIQHQQTPAHWPLLLTVNQATDFAGLPRPRLYELMGAGLLKPVRLGRRVMFTKASLEEFVAKLEAGEIHVAP